MLLAFCSCVARVEKAGYMFDSYDISNVAKNITSKQTILKNMGTPTIKSYLNDEETWIYLAEDIRHFLFLKPKVVSRNVLALSFNKEDLVEDLWQLDLSHENHHAKFHSKYTAVDGHRTSAIKELFENIGQVRPL